MKHNFSILVLSLLLGAMAMPAFSQVSNDNEDEVNKVDQRFGQDYVPGQVLVKMKDSSPANVRKIQGKFKSAGIGQLDAVLQEFGVEGMEQLLPHEKPGRTLRKAKAFNGSVVQERDLSQLYLLQMKEDKAMETHQLIERLAELPEVEYAEPNYKAYIMADVNSFGLEPLFSQLWGLTAINMPNMWRSAPTITQKRPVIALLDTGVDITHPDLAANIWTNTAETEGEEGYDNDNNGFKNDVHGWDFINQTGDIRDFNGHGTHCAGIAAAIGDNSLGVVGANPDALIMPITIMQSDGTGDLATIIRGIDYAIAMGADVLSMSIGTYATSSAFEEALGRAYQNAILVAAAGNDGYCLNHAHIARGQMAPMPMFPAAYNFVLGVQASAASGAMAGFSNYDDDGAFFSAYDENELYNYELRAPGASIMSIWPGGKYRSLNGTSMACPLVAGALSRLIQCKEIDSKEELFGDLIHSTTLVGDLDIYKAYQMNDANRQPTLSLVTYTIDDSEGDGDGLIDAGETIAIYPTLRNEWGTATNIQLSIELDETEDPDILEFLDDNVAFGSNLSSYAMNISTTPLRFRISDVCADNRHIKLVLKATCDETTSVCRNSFVLEVKNVTKFSGMITQDTTLEGDKTYYIDNDILVSGCTLTIEPGAKLEFVSGKTLKVLDGAHLNAHGQPGKMITFIRGNIVIPSNTNVTLWTNDDYSRWALKRSEDTPNEFGRNRLYSSDNFGYNNIFLVEVDSDLLTKDYDETHPYSVSFKESNDTLEYCYFKGSKIEECFLNDCVLTYSPITGNYSNKYRIAGNRINSTGDLNFCQQGATQIYNSNILYIYKNMNPLCARYVRDNNYLNIIGGIFLDSSSAFYGGGDGTTTQMYRPSYFGTSREDLIRPYIREFGNANGIYTTLDLSNMRTQPVAEAHGIVWKVVVNGYDAQDEFEQLPPLGVGRHKFEVYFNRPMNVAVAPQISFGVCEPYTQHPVAEDGEWSADSTVYTAYYTITGKTKSDGLNRIYVYGAEDNEFFEIINEKTRFNINIQATGSMATGFMAEAGLGRVNLTWNNDENNFDDAMGFNIYRYTEATINNPTRINEEIVDVETTEYVDYDVTPGTTYYYMYKVLSTDLQEYDVSNVVAVTPLTGELGDANGSGDVDVADVITTVNYAAGQQPKPFIFEAADMNTDLSIDILDVIGIIKKIMNPSAGTQAFEEATATYTIENGILYVESPVALAGVQVQLALDEGQEVTVANDLNGFEHTSAWLSDNDYLFLAYNMSGKTLPAGKHALLHIGNGLIAQMRLADNAGRNVEAIGDDATRINRMAGDVMTVPGIYDLQGRKITGNSEQQYRLPKGVYIINGKKVVR
ncbi:MAG: S8 family serine peptidase [Bacteroidaceae bacterium]|nr:S8 family serine peptidase [Bacteroidaceae bacterium]